MCRCPTGCKKPTACLRTTVDQNLAQLRLSYSNTVYRLGDHCVRGRYVRSRCVPSRCVGEHIHRSLYPSDTQASSCLVQWTKQKSTSVSLSGFFSSRIVLNGLTEFVGLYCRQMAYLPVIEQECLANSEQKKRCKAVPENDLCMPIHNKAQP